MESVRFDLAEVHCSFSIMHIFVKYGGEKQEIEKTLGLLIFFSFYQINQNEITGFLSFGKCVSRLEHCRNSPSRHALAITLPLSRMTKRQVQGPGGSLPGEALPARAVSAAGLSEPWPWMALCKHLPLPLENSLASPRSTTLPPTVSEKEAKIPHPSSPSPSPKRRNFDQMQLSPLPADPHFRLSQTQKGRGNRRKTHFGFDLSPLALIQAGTQLQKCHRVQSSRFQKGAREAAVLCAPRVNS